MQSLALAIVGFHKIGIRGPREPEAAVTLSRISILWLHGISILSNINCSDEFLWYRLIPRHPAGLHCSYKKGTASITILVSFSLSLSRKRPFQNRSVFVFYCTFCWKQNKYYTMLHLHKYYSNIEMMHNTTMHRIVIKIRFPFYFS